MSQHTLLGIRPIRKAIIAPLRSVDRLYPASTALTPLLFPLVDRDGLSKPLLQIIAEDAIESGIETIGVVSTLGVRSQCDRVFTDWQMPAGVPDDWMRLQREKLTRIAATLQYIDASPGRESDLIEHCRAFADGQTIAYLPADVLYVSGTKDRCLEQMLAVGGDDVDCVLAVAPIMAREAYAARVVCATAIDRRSSITAIIEHPTLEQCKSLHTPGLPPGQFLAATGMALLGPEFLDDVDKNASFVEAIDAVSRRGKSFAASLGTSCFNLQTPYGLLEAQLGLGLAGIHRVEICEMIARTLADQAKN